MPTTDLTLRPAVAIACTLGATVIALSVTSLGWLALLGALPLSRILWRRSARRVLQNRLRTVLPLALVAALARTLAAQSEVSVWACAPMFTRVLVASLWMTWLSTSLSPRAMDAGLLRIGVSSSFVELFALTRRFALQLRETLQIAWSAAAVRGGFNSVSAVCVTIGPLAGMIMVRALDRSEQVSAAMALRGYGLSDEHRP